MEGANTTQALTTAESMPATKKAEGRDGQGREGLQTSATGDRACEPRTVIPWVRSVENAPGIRAFHQLGLLYSREVTNLTPQFLSSFSHCAIKAPGQEILMSPSLTEILSFLEFSFFC